MQVGSSINYTDNAVRVFQPLIGNRDRTQVFTTLGLFPADRRLAVGGLPMIYLYQNSYDTVQLGQVRGRVGYDVTPTNEIGVWFTINADGDNAQAGPVAVRLDPISQGNFYWRHIWETQAETTLWIGVAEGHGEVNLALGDATPQDEVLVFGADLHASVKRLRGHFWAGELSHPGGYRNGGCVPGF